MDKTGQKWRVRSYPGGWFGIHDEDNARIAAVEREEHAKLMTASPAMLHALESVFTWLDSGQADDAAIYTEVKTALSLARNGGNHESEQSG